MVLLVVVGLLVASALIITSKKTRLGLDLKGGVELVYQGEPTPQVPKVTPQAIDDAITTIRKRTDSLGVSEPEIQRSGSDEISIGLPDVKNVERAEQQVGSTAQLQFYDWEPNVFKGPNELVDPATAASDPAPNSPIFSIYQAVLRASESKPRAEATDVPAGGPDPAIVKKFNGNTQQIREYYDKRNDTTGDQYYLFNPAPKGQNPTLITGPASSCQELLSDYSDKLARGAPAPAPRAVTPGTQCAPELEALGAAGPPEGSKVLKVPQGVVVIGEEATKGAKPGTPPPGYFVIEDDSELSGSDIKNPKVGTDPQTGAPVVTMDFTNKGRKQFAAVTKRIAERGAGQIGTGPAANRFQRFAITLDNQIISLATIDFQQNPDGIDGRTGAQIDNIGSYQETSDLAENLRIGALPINLKLISKTQVSSTLGKQALHQGLIAGAVGLMLTLIFLLSFYRILGLVAALGLVIYAVILFAVVKLIPITVTLPGIAGLILTLGVAADANIVIFERIKEEARRRRLDPAGDLRRLRQGAADDHRRERGHARRGVHPVHARDGGREGLRVHAAGRHARLAVHRGARHLGDPRHDGAHAHHALAPHAGRRQGAHSLALRLHGQLEVVLRDVGHDPARRRARDRGPRVELRHRLRVRHAHHHPGASRRPPSPRCATRSRRSATATRRSRRSRTTSSASTSSRSR